MFPVFVAKEQLEADVRLFLENQIDWLVLTTGMGTSALIDVADQLGAKEAFIKKLHQVKIAARGYKTMAVLLSLLSFKEGEPFYQSGWNTKC